MQQDDRNRVKRFLNPKRKEGGILAVHLHSIGKSTMPHVMLFSFKSKTRKYC